MTIQDLGSVGELVAAVATVVTLAYLATQIRQNTRSVRATGAVSFAETNSALNLLLCQDYEASKVYFGGLAGTLELDGVQEKQFDLMVGQFINHLQQASILESEGVLNEELAEAARLQLNFLVRQPGFRSYWDRWRDVTHAAFRRRVETAIATSATSLPRS